MKYTCKFYIKCCRAPNDQISLSYSSDKSTSISCCTRAKPNQKVEVSHMFVNEFKMFKNLTSHNVLYDSNSCFSHNVHRAWNIHVPKYTTSKTLNDNIVSFYQCPIDKYIMKTERVILLTLSFQYVKVASYLLQLQP